MKYRLVGAIISVLLTLVLAVPTFAAAAPNPKGPPDFERIVFIHYQKDAKPSVNGKIPSELYSYSGYRWPILPIQYSYNSSGSPFDALTAVQDSFQTWDDVANSRVSFAYNNTNSTVSPGLNAKTPDYKNVVGWAPLNDSKAIAVTIIWSRPGKYVVDCDTVFNTDSWLSWSMTGSSPDTDRYDCDVQNIMTHEAGHWLVLNDLYNAAASEQTMFGTAGQNETKKCSLESGDIAGVHKIYP